MVSLFRIALDYIRHDHLRALQSALAIHFEVAMILCVVGIEHGMASHPKLVETQIGLLALASFLLITLVSFLFGIVDRYMATLERSQDIGVLKALGASSTQVVTLFAQEALMLVIPGTILGLVLTYCLKWITAAFLSDYLTVEIVYAWWPSASAISACGAILGTLIALRRIEKHGIVNVLSEKA